MCANFDVGAGNSTTIASSNQQLAVCGVNHTICTVPAAFGPNAAVGPARL